MQILYALTFREGNWYIRIDPPHVSGGQRHVHITAGRVRGEYSWNVDGTRHDKHKFPANEKAIHAAKRLAAKHLGVSAAQLSFLTMLPAFGQVEISPEQSVTDKPRGGAVAVVLFSRVKAQIMFLRGRAGRVHILLIENDGDEVV